MTKTEKKIKRLVLQYMEDNDLTLEGVRTGRERCDLPIGGRRLWAIVRGGHSISLKQQAELLSFFGYHWELKYFDL